jgi:methylation protein EvaC
MKKSFQELSKKIKKKFKPKKIIEIGSNDGSFVKHFENKKIICVEPCGNLAKITKKLGYETYNKFWDSKLINIIKNKKVKIDLIYSANTISHINNLNEVFKCIAKILDKSGVCIIEDPSLLETIKKNIFDQFYNEHIYVFSYTSLKKILKKYNLEIYNVENISTHGGSTRYYIKKIKNKKIKIKDSVLKQQTQEKIMGIHKIQTYIDFSKRVNKSKLKFINIIKNLKKINKKIIGYGATAKSCTVLNFCKINNKDIEYFIDTTPEKQNRYTPGTHIPIIKKPKRINPLKTIFYLGAWNFLKEIKRKEKKFVSGGGKFLIHTPYPRII